MHVPTEPAEPLPRRLYWDRQKRTMDSLAPWARKHEVRMALENTLPGNFDTLERFFALCGPDVMGLCYDSGHGNARVDWPGNGLERLERVRSRLIDLHLHDNDGSGDLHWPPFSGTVDWKGLARIVPTTSYRKGVIPVECGVRLKDPTPAEEMAFLRKMAGLARRFGKMVEKARQTSARP
jgi:sugar phosphate isomerase/epimerase